MNFQTIAGNDGSAEARVVDCHEIDEITALTLAAGADRTCRLGHGLDDQNARHDRAIREMTGEMRFVDRHVLDANRRIITIDLDDLVDEQERVTMRQKLHDFQNVSRAERRLGFFSHRFFLLFFYHALQRAPEYRPCRAGNTSSDALASHHNGRRPERRRQHRSSPQSARRHQ
ncbi:hypothetical protein D3C87_1453360 [compost metagenome]